MERIPAQRSDVDECAELRCQVAALEQENNLLESERDGSLTAVKVYVTRLQNVGMSTDYRRQPGE